MEHLPEQDKDWDLDLCMLCNILRAVFIWKQNVLCPLPHGRDPAGSRFNPA